MRPGFTLVEAIVALVLLEIGMLAFAAASSLAARDLAYAQRSARAHALARNRTESLRATRCPGPGTGRVEHSGGLTEVWTVRAEGLSRVISDSVAFPLHGG